MRRLAVALLTLGALTGGGVPASGAGPGPGAPGEEPTRGTPPLADDRRILHVLNRLAFGPRSGDLERVRAVGVEAWIERQLHPETIADAATERALATLASLRLSIPEALRDYPRPEPKLREKLQAGQLTRQEMKRPFRITAELQAAKMLRAVESERQLQEVMVDFWFNHFNVFAAKGDVRWYVSAYERDVIRPNALGRFPDLVRASARHPAMLFYLDNWLSARPDFTVPAGGPKGGRKAGLNENYARELMELHTLGVDGGYTQTDVTEVARALTGWSIDRPQTEGRFAFRPRIAADWRAALPGAAADRLPGPRRGVGELRGAPGTDELRPGPREEPLPACRRGPGLAGHRRRDARRPHGRAHEPPDHAPDGRGPRSGIDRRRHARRAGPGVARVPTAVGDAR